MSEVTVVIPNYKGKKYLCACVDSLFKSTKMELSVIIVDNASEDGSIDEVKQLYPQVRCIMLDKNYGFCRAVNIGIKEADTPFVFLLNNDTLVCKGAVDALLAAIRQDDGIFSVESKMIQYQDHGRLDSAGTYYNALGWAFARGKDKPAVRYQKKTDSFAACGGASIYRKKAFDDIGYFDEEHFAYLEDVDIGYRARILGWRNVYEPKARIIHVGSAASGSRYNEFKVRLSARNNLYMIYKNMPTMQIFFNLPFLAAGFLVKYLFFLKKGMGDLYMKGLRDAIPMMKKKKKIAYQKGYVWNYLKIQIELWINIFRLI